MTLRDRIRRSFVPALMLLAALLTGCGSNESVPSPAKPGSHPPEEPDQAYSDLADSSVREITLTTSPEFDAAAGEVRLFAVVRGQDTNLLANLNKFNFQVVLRPESNQIPLDPSQTSLTTDAVADRVVALVIDSSGSMGGTLDANSPKTRLAVAQEAAKKYVSLMQGGDRAAIVTFSDAAKTVQALTDDKTLLNRAIDSLSPTAATNFGAAIEEAVNAVGTRPGRRAMILLTDGDDTVDLLGQSLPPGPDVWLGNDKSIRNQGLTAAKTNGFRIYTVGLGAELQTVGLADLHTFAQETGGTFFTATSADALAVAFGETIPGEIAQLDPMETYVLRFPAPAAAAAEGDVAAAYRLIVTYENALGEHVANSEGVYQVPAGGTTSEE